MKKKIYIFLLMIAMCIILVGCIKDDNNKQKEDFMINNDIKEKKSMKVIIENNEYIVNLEDNATVNALIELLPLELNMKELNGNEKYYYLDSTLPTNSKNPGKIEKGDVMLYGNDCIVVFYKTFNTSYSYTKIGHIDNLPNLGNGNIKILFSR